jgi:hypothetical protein
MMRFSALFEVPQNEWTVFIKRFTTQRGVKRGRKEEESETFFH